MLKHGVQPDMPAQNRSGDYVTSTMWCPEPTASQQHSGGAVHQTVGGDSEQRPCDDATYERPSEATVRQHMQRNSRDWSQSMKSTTGLSSNQRLRLTGRMSHEEWALMYHAELLMRELELEVGTQQKYRTAVEHFVAFLTRYPLASRFSAAHAEHLGLLQPAVWKYDEIDAVLIDFVLHEVAVHGNGWSTVHGKLYGIRHYNVRRNAGNPIMGKLRLQQLMKGLKKYKGPGPGKLAVTMSMMDCMRRRLNLVTDQDHLGSTRGGVSFHDAVC